MVFPVALFPTSTVLRVSVEKKAGKMDDHGLIWGQFSKRCQMPWQRMLGALGPPSDAAALSRSMVPDTRSRNEKHDLDHRLCPVLTPRHGTVPTSLSATSPPPSGHFSDSLAPCEGPCLYFPLSTQLHPHSTSHLIPWSSVPAATMSSYCQLMLTAAKSP